MNTIKTASLLAALTALFMGIGYLIGGPGGAMIALMVAGGMNLFAYWQSDKMVLRMHGATLVDERSAPHYVRLVRQLAQNAALPMPATYIMEQPQPNAFATGRNPENGSRERGGLIGSIALAILAPMAAGLVQMAISRTREYEADAMGAAISGRPLWLASALDKIEGAAHRIDNDAAEANPATAHMFIINPLHGGKRDSLFSTHPATANRIAKLREIAAEEARAAGRPWG